MVSSAIFVALQVLALCVAENSAKPIRDASSRRNVLVTRNGTASDDSRSSVNIGGQQVSLASYSGDPNDFFGGSLSSKKGNNGKGNIVTVQTKEIVQCKKTDVVVIQQRLAILQELMKKVVTTLTCDVETQITVIEQVRGGIKEFSQDVRRVVTQKSVSQSNQATAIDINSKSQSQSQGGTFDESFASQLSALLDATGQLSTNDLGLKGTDLGSNSVAPQGSNWNDSTSPASVGAAYKAAVSDFGGSGKNASNLAGNATVSAGGQSNKNATRENIASGNGTNTAIVQERSEGKKAKRNWLKYGVKVAK